MSSKLPKKMEFTVKTDEGYASCKIEQTGENSARLVCDITVKDKFK